MMESQDIEQMIRSGIDAEDVIVVDLTGTKDHFRVQVVSKQFEGKTLLEQHRMVQATVQAAIDDGRIHAFSVVTSAA